MHSTTALLDNTCRYTIKLQLTSFSSELWRQAWIDALLDVGQEAKELPTSIDAASSPEQQQFLTFMLGLARTLLQQVNVPVFTNLTPVRLQPDVAANKVCLLTVQLPVIDFIPQGVILRALEAAARMAVWVAGNPPSMANLEHIFAALSAQLLKPLRKQVPGGKSTIPVLRAAHQQGIPFLHLGAGVYQLGWGSKARRMDRGASGHDSYCGVKLSQSKVLTANLLRIAGMPAPHHEMATNEQEAVDAAQRLGYPVVVKPVYMDRGEGVSVDIRDDAALAAAFGHACQVAKRTDALIERHVEGVCHRLLVADGKLLYAVARMPMSVTADGHSTIAALVDSEVGRQQQRAPWLRSEIKALDRVAQDLIATHGYTAETTPPAGAVIPLRRIESTADGGVDIDVTSVLHPDNEALAIDAARLAGLQMAGVDIISPDIRQPWHHNAAIISEINFSPLLGGGAISRAAIPRFLAYFIAGDGRIPVESCGAKAEAVARQEHWLAQGLRCYCTGADWTLDPHRRFLAMPFNDAGRRVQALLYRSDVDAIICHR